MGYDFDVAVLGGGSAGTSAARASEDTGARTVMINDGELGGLCILRGCMPTKAMLASAHVLHEANHPEAFGLRREGRVVADFPAIMARKAAMVERFKAAKIASIEAQDYEVIDGRARFVNPEEIEVSGRRIRARAYVIATGSIPTILPIPGLEECGYLTSDDVMRMEAPPKRLVVQGAGPIGLELAQFFARIGSDVLLVNRSPLLSKCDDDAGAELTRSIEAEERFDLAVPGKILSLERRDDASIAFEIEAAASGRFVHYADALLMAAGRQPEIADLGLEAAGIDAGDFEIKHDEKLQTSNPRVFVAGDATGCHQILHIANQEGAVAGKNAAKTARSEGGADERMDYRLKMTVIFSDPPFATVGMNEVELKAAGRRFITGSARFPETGRAITMGTTHGVWKLFADPENGRILGSSILGPRADDLIHLVAQMMFYDGTFEDIAAMPWYHPTLSEVMLNLLRTLRS